MTIKSPGVAVVSDSLLEDAVSEYLVNNPPASGAPGKDATNPNFSASATTLTAGASATAAISGTYPNLTVTLGLPRGADGAAPANPSFTATATTLAAGTNATASITGAYPNLTLTLGLPRGAAGATPTITVGTVTTLAAGSQATASFTGTALNLGLPQGAAGASPATPTLTIGTVTTLGAGASATASITGSGPAYTLNLGIPAGPGGSNGASLGTATPRALGAANPGSSNSAAREDHVHPLPAGLLTNLGNVTISETMLVSLGLGIQRRTATLAGVAVGDRLLFTPNGVPTAGCEAVNVYASATNQVTVSMFLPALGIGATYNVPITVYRITA